MYTDISQEWKSQCEHIKDISQPIDLKSFGVDKLEKDISMEFKVVQYMTQTEQHLKKLYTNPNHFNMNRNPHIMTFDQNRVLLSSDINHRDCPDYYINANFIEVQGHKIIATQAPLQVTLNNFWKMIYRYNVKAIFMLCQRVEKQKVKCYLYWPSKTEDVMEIGDFKIKLVQKLEIGKYTKVRKFLLINTLQNQQREVLHYQFVGWPDGDRPKVGAEKSLRKLLCTMNELIMKGDMVVVHCSAGVGRTGTFIAMSEIKSLIPKEEPISIFQIVRKLRQQRWAMVYTTTQYEYLYQFTEKQTIMFFQSKINGKQLEESEDSNGENNGGQTQVNCEGEKEKQI